MSRDESEKAALVSTHNDRGAECFVGVIDKPWAQAAKTAVLRREGLSISDMFRLDSATACRLVDLINAEAASHRP